MDVIGGRAHINGVTFVTNTHIVRGKLSKGNMTIRVRRLPGTYILNLMDNVPFLRGISKLAKLNLKLFLGIILFLLIPWDWIFPSGSMGSEPLWADLSIYGIILLTMVVLFRQLWQFHGAEHKAFNIYTSGTDLTLSTVRQASRISERCGTNLAVIAIPITILLSFVAEPLLLVLTILPISYEIFNWSSRRKYRLKPAFFVARFIQQYLVTAEPNEEQLQLATATLLKAIEL